MSKFVFSSRTITNVDSPMDKLSYPYSIYFLFYKMEQCR